MNINKNLNDPKNLSIYNGIYPNKRKLIDYIKIEPEYIKKKSKNGKKIEPLDYNFDNDTLFNNNNTKELSIINSCSNKENLNNFINNTTNNKSHFINKKEKLDNNNFLYKSPDIIRKKSKNNRYKSNTNNFNIGYKNNYLSFKKTNKKNKKNQAMI